MSIVIILILLDNKQNYRFSVSIEKFLFFGGRNKILFVKKNRSMEKAIFQDDIFQEKNLDLGLDVTLNSFLPFSFLILLLIQHFFKKLSKTEKLNILQMIAILWTTRSYGSIILVSIILKLNMD